MKHPWRLFAIVVFLSALQGLGLQAEIPDSQRQALIALYNATGGDSWATSTGWKTPPLHTDGFALPGTEGTWFGVYLDAEGLNVAQISLGNNNLSGEIPAAVADLTALTSLSLSQNPLTGSIPPALGGLSGLQVLNLSYTQLGGSIPPELGGLSSLTNLSLSSNQLTGSIPAELGSLAALQVLYLSSNQLSGSIPAELGNLTELTQMSLAANQLTGSIPATLGNLKKVFNLYLYNNLLEGSIPPELGGMTALWSFWLASNRLTGSIPPELGGLANLRDLQFGGNQLTGSIPAELGNLANLQGLSLYVNQLSGPIPPELGNLANLRTMALHANRLSGPIPPELGDLANLQNLQLQNNQLSDAIPADLGNLTSLTYLYLSGNDLTGPIPPELGGMTSLQYLYLQANHLTGPIPAELGALTNLIVLDVGGNILEGPIPPALTALVNLSSSWTRLGFNALWADDPDLIAFLNAKDPDWADTQTIAPAEVTATSLDGADILVSWLPVSYVGASGCYLVYISETEGGPYSLAGQTESKSVSSVEVTGLTPGRRYYFVVTTRTDASLDNKNVVESAESEEVSAVAWLQTSVRIAGTVTVDGAPLAGVAMSGLPGSPLTGETGGYDVAVDAGWSGTVTPSLAGYVFTPASLTYAEVTEDQLAQDYAARLLVPTITVVSPNGGESWAAGSTHDVTWTQTDLTGTVEVTLYKGGAYVKALGTAEAAAGTFPWTIAGSELPGTDYRIVLWQGDVSDESDGEFAITAAASSRKVDFNGDGQEDILWRYYGEGAYQGLTLAWLMDWTETASPIPLATDLEMATPESVLTAATASPAVQAPRAVEIPRSAAAAPNRAFKTILSGEKTPGLRPERIMTDPISATDNGTTELASLTLGTEVLISVIPDTGWEIAGTADFNGDGKTDILWRNYGDGPYLGMNDIWFMDGPAMQSEDVFSVIADIAWRIAGTGDFNSDGKTDILWRYYGSGALQGYNVIWFMDGSVFQSEVVFSAIPDTDWRIEGTGDFNSDGKTDILWRYYGAGALQGYNVVWYMNGWDFQGEAVFSQILDTGWEIAGTGDFNADGKTDILWRYYGTGAYQGMNDVWYMDGTTFLSEEIFSVIPDTNWRIVNR